METTVEPKLDMTLNAANHARNQAMLDFAKRLYAPIVQEMENDMAALRRRLQLADATIDAMINANAEVGAKYVQACRWARAWKQAAKNEHEARYILQVLLTEYEAHGRIAPIPVIGELSAATTEDDWKAMWARVGE